MHSTEKLEAEPSAEFAEAAKGGPACRAVRVVLPSLLKGCRSGVIQAPADDALCRSRAYCREVSWTWAT